MKIKSGYVLKHVGEQIIVVPIGQVAVTFQGIITLNQTGKFLFESLQEETNFEKLVDKMVTNYDIDEQTAKRDIKTFIDKLIAHEIIDV